MAFPDINIGSKFDAKGFKQAQSATDKLNKGVKNLAKTFGLTFGTAAVLSYAKASVKAAAADQKAQQQLALALKNVGLERDAASAESFVQKLQSEYGIVDDLLRPAYQKLAVATKNTAETQRLLGIALDISASTGKDLDTVTGALSKAYLGNNTALGKLGVGISKADLKTKSFKDITDDLSKTFKGSAKAASETFAGSIAKLGVASNNVKEIIGTGLIDALKMLGDDKSVSELATNMENAATYIANVTRGMGVLLSQLEKLPGGFKLDVAMIPIIGTYLSLLNEAGAKAARIAAVGGQKNPIQSGSYLSTQKKITALTKEQAAAQAKILADKKSQAILDKANLALAKGNDVFNMDAIQLNAALIGQAEALGKATTGAQILAIANDVQRLKVKQDINALEDAIASKDEAAIVKATAKLNEDLKILGALQKQDAKLLDINNVLAGMKSTDLINLANLQAALDLLAKFKFPALTFPTVPTGPGGGGPKTPTDTEKPTYTIPKDTKDFTQNNPFIFKLIDKTVGFTSDSVTDAFFKAMNAGSDLPGAVRGANYQAQAEAQYKKFIDNISLTNQIANASLTQGLDANLSLSASLSGARYAAQAAAMMGGGEIVVTVVDKTSGLIEVVQNAVQENNRFGNNLTFAGAIS